MKFLSVHTVFILIQYPLRRYYFLQKWYLITGFIPDLSMLVLQTILSTKKKAKEQLPPVYR